MDILLKYFPELTATQQQQFEALPALYAEWNAKINVISRQDVDNLLERHVLHSLAIAKFMPFVAGSTVLDLGTGGGFPGIPLAVLFPDTQFALVDSIGKKVKVAQEVADALALKNVTTIHSRAENLKMFGQFEFIVSRAVAPLVDLMNWSHRLIKKRGRHAYPNGLIALKGGNLRGEISALPGKAEEYTELIPVSNYFKEPYFQEKFVVYVQG